MGLIKKKTTSRGTEGGVKYVCDACSSDVTSTVSSAHVVFGHAANIHSRSASAAQVPSAMSSIFALHAFQKASRLATTILEHTHTKS